ncbi:hypothetical protein [Desemzia sp. FAM 23991]|uniref:hypothetical protein n=1 Tax=unclassified Desemzia TaxID=2685243 RepID=UPI003884318D
MKWIALILTAFLFAGCSTQEETGSTDSTASQVASSSPAAEEDLAPVPEEELDSADSIQSPDYPELTVIQEKIDLETVESYLMTDNQGTRVMIFVEDGEQAYKSIYIKSDNRLKLVNLKSDELMIDEEWME